MRIRHILGPSMPSVEARILRSIRMPKLYIYVLLSGALLGVISPVSALAVQPLWIELAFWILATVLFLPIYIAFELLYLRFWQRLGRNTAPEIVTMLSTLMVLAPIMISFALLLGVRFDDLWALALDVFVVFLLLELCVYLYIVYADAVLFPEIYAPPYPVSHSDPTGQEVVLRGTTFPLTSIDSIVAQTGSSEVHGLGRTETIPRGFTDVVAELPVDLGFQVHRSIWVSRATARQTVREGRKLFVVTLDGRRLPIARSRQQEFLNWLKGLPADGQGG